MSGVTFSLFSSQGKYTFAFSIMLGHDIDCQCHAMCLVVLLSEHCTNMHSKVIFSVDSFGNLENNVWAQEAAIKMSDSFPKKKKTKNRRKKLLYIWKEAL